MARARARVHFTAAQFTIDFKNIENLLKNTQRCYWSLCQNFYKRRLNMRRQAGTFTHYGLAKSSP
jgi:hypothetical protein